MASFWTRQSPATALRSRSTTTQLHDGPIAFDPFLYFVSPLQLWLDRLVAVVNKTGTMEDAWLPVFATASARLRSVFARLRVEHHPKAAFFVQWEVAGLLVLSAALELVAVVASLCAPLVLHELLRNTQNEVLAWMLVAASLAATLAGRAKNQVSRVQSSWLEAMLRSSIFEKSMRLSPAARRAHPPAQIINMSAVDVDSVSVYVSKIHDIWSAPLQIIAIAVLASSIIGPSALIGFLLMLVMLVGQSWASKVTRRSVVIFSQLNDQRLASLRELLSNIKSVKASACEFVFRERISHVRNEQIKAVWAYLSMAFGLFTAISSSIPSFTAAAAFLTYYLTGNELSASVVFPALAYFHLLQQPVFAASLAVTRQSSVLPSITRIKALMTAEESDIFVHPSGTNNIIAINFKDARFTHATYNDDPTQSWHLEVGNLAIPRNIFTVVIGPTASGKSSLLQAILGEMNLEKGSVDIHGTIAYVAQDAWIMSGTLRDNIVFMSEFDPVGYQDVVSLCCLDEDFQAFPGGDQFIVGEAGSNLSGGQRARIALARALYSQPDILLLDDPLSAVDGRVREALFQTLRSLHITVVLITLHTSFVPLVDNIVMIEENRVVWSGPIQNMLARSGTRDSVLSEEWLSKIQAMESNLKKSSSVDRTKIIDPHDPGDDGRTVTVVELIEEEERAQGTVKLGVVGFYARCSGGSLQLLGVVLLTISLIATKVMASYWFVWWIADGLGLRQGQYLGGYLGLTLGQTVFTTFLALGLVFGSLQASKNIHATIIDNLLSAPVAYFQRQPTGRILNRMSSDIESLDAKIINAVDAVLGAGTNLLASLCLISVSSPIVMAAVIPYILVTGFFQSRFRVSARELQRTTSILQSPVAAIVSEALSAPASIKAYGAIMFMVAKHSVALDQLTSAKIVRKSLDTWITLRVELAAVMLQLVVSLLTVRDQIPSVLGGLALTFATTLTNDVYLLAWGLTDLEIQMNSIERLQVYHDHLPKEGRHQKQQIEMMPPPEDWPGKGDIHVQNVSLIYPSRSAPALDNISLHIRSGERLGVVGRTGCGKSTLVSCMARLVDPTSGNIIVDGVDILSVSPQQLRVAIHTLPQEPLVYEGTIRENMDPKEEYTNEEILEVLEQCHLRSTLSEESTSDVLSKRLTTGGTNISAGQRQLLCAARVLLRKPHILLVDEAAANIDYTSDEVLQRALRIVFPESTTMMVIAHRAASIAWLERIIVMESGKIVEEGTPLELLEREGSYYHRMVSIEGDRVFQNALEMARERQAGDS